MNSQSRLRRLLQTLTDLRESRSGPRALPAEIWEEAAKLSNELSVSIVASKLGLNYSKLKKLAEATKGTQPKQLCPKSQSDRPLFLEVLSAAELGRAEKESPSTSQCALELKSSTGSLLRAKLEGLSAVDLGTLFREFAR